MIVVMPNGNATQSVSQGFGYGPTPARQSVDGAGAAAGAGAQQAARCGRAGGAAADAADTPQPYAGSYPESLVKDVIPFVEKRFRVLAAKDNRAIAGLSMGGGHTLAATNNNPGTFAYIGVFSSGPRTVDETFQKQLDAVKAGGVKFYWLGAGTHRHGARRHGDALRAREEGRLQDVVPRDPGTALLVPVARFPRAVSRRSRFSRHRSHEETRHGEQT